MDRAGLPSPSLSCTSRSSQDLGKSALRRSQYRLFPVVLPTPPASPVTLQRTSLTRATSTVSASSRRRSLSVETAGRDSTSTSLPPSSVLLANSSTRDTRKATPSDIHNSSTLSEFGRQAASPDAIHPRKPPAADRASDYATCATSGRPNSASSSSTTSSIYERDRPVASHSNHLLLQAASNAPGTSSFNVPLSPVVENPSPSANGRMRTKPKPNLRITVDKRDESLETPPRPPPKSPRLPISQEGKEGRRLAARPSQSPSIEEENGRLNRPHTPQRTYAAQPQASQNVEVGEPATSSDPPRGQPNRQQSDSTHHPILSASEEKHLLETRTVLGPLSAAPSRPRTSDGRSRLPGCDDASQRPATAAANPRDMQLPGVKSSNTLNGRVIRSLFSRTTPTPTQQPSNHKPQHQQQPTKPDWRPLVPLATPLSRRPASPQADEKTGEHPTSTSEQPEATRSGITEAQVSSPERISGAETPAVESHTPSAALATARANVAALMNSASTSGSPPKRNQSSDDEVGTLGRGVPQKMPRRPSSSTGPDPVATLKTLGEECDALHLKYATLKAERQKISGNIIAILKQDSHKPDFASTLLDEQLSLAAVSSSMDICFVKLKSLECRKEDAIADLVAKATPVHTAPIDHISAMIASMALTRKPSRARSVASSSRYPPTGRSTPEVSDCSTRIMSYSSESDNPDDRASSQPRKQSWSYDNRGRSGSVDKHTPAPTVRGQAHGSLSTSSDGQVSEPSNVTPSVLDIIASARAELVSRCEDGSDENLQYDMNRISAADWKSLAEEAFDDRPKWARANGLKVAKILGLLSHGADGKVSPLVRLPNQRTMRSSTEEKPETYSTSKADDQNGEAASILPVHTKDTVHGLTNGDKPVPSDMHDLELQLQSFPTPKSLSLRSISNSRRNTGGSFLTTGSSAESLGDELPETPPIPQQVPKSKMYRAWKKRDPAAPNVQVCLDAGGVW